jgi:hypothetical protein
MTLNDLLRGNDIDSERVFVLRHRPSKPELRKVLRWLAAEKRDVFIAYPSRPPASPGRSIKIRRRNLSLRSDATGGSIYGTVYCPPV